MYRQVNITERQRNLQRILWRSSSDGPVQAYTLNTVTYGIIAAPFMVIRALQQTAHNAHVSHPDAARVILRDFYVDDLLTGHDDLDQLRVLKDEITSVLKSGGFELAKWRSNEPTLFKHDIEDAVRISPSEEEVKTLGLLWKPNRDSLQYQVIIPRISSKVTKRTVLSVIAQIFDPLGLVGPATVKAKLLLQRLWQRNIDWDESLPQDLHHKWIAYVAELESLNDIVVPRVIICPNPELVELHGFSDASEGAYGACVYLQSISREGVVTIRLICAKSKVAPLKTICIPRLELCGALLLSNLAKSVLQALTIPLTNRYYWCDSTIVLAWIRGEPHLRKTFVANRLTEIQQMTDQEQWHYVKSEHNPADVISRGISPKQLKDLHLW
ncbi:PREDICTED: uncharacterized protein LOC105556903 [Vollenhovia emeryi]|uniref:uncharacterized protein LOC105556903 n=1 Tax=Vollenhovia emeryi TaxID=411798 RepID=UPI0005F4AEC5|nr:PREDICTED: uncharacterized protein LOC105556903 [Vollenhovia emeryi]